MGFAKSAKELEVYQLAYELAMRVFEVSKSFPLEERFALTSQIRRSSRSVCMNLREAWAKRTFSRTPIFSPRTGARCTGRRESVSLSRRRVRLSGQRDDQN